MPMRMPGRENPPPTWSLPGTICSQRTARSWQKASPLPPAGHRRGRFAAPGAGAPPRKHLGGPLRRPAPHPLLLTLPELTLTRSFARLPFVPQDAQDLSGRCEMILHLQASGLKTRLAHTGVQHAVVGLSGGLDSTLALLVTVRAFDALSLPRKGILAVTMPGIRHHRPHQGQCGKTGRASGGRFLYGADRRRGERPFPGHWPRSHGTRRDV